MSALQALRDGDVSEALELVKDEVRHAPQDAKHRVFLFQLFTIIGHWDRALSQLKVASELDEDCKLLADAYQHIVQCEAFREQVFLGERMPLLFGEPEPWMAMMLEAQRLSALSHHEQATELRNGALDQAESSSGTVTLRRPDDQSLSESSSFEWIADADSRMGPFLEVVMQGKYYWVPFSRIKAIEPHDISDLRDYVWLPAQFTWIGGGEMVGMIPVRYPGTQNSADGLLQLARKTEWEQVEENTYFGTGQRMFATDEADHALLDVSSIEFEEASP